MILDFFTVFSRPYVHFLLLGSVFLSGFRMFLDFFTAFSVLYVHFLLPGSVFLFGFRIILDFFTAFLGFMSIFSCSAPYFPLASGEFWTFLLFFLALCPFSSAQLRISLWLPENFGLFYCFSWLYVHFLLLSSVFPSGFRMILDFFTAFLDLMSIFSCSVPYFSLASGWFWTFLRFFCALCPFSTAQFRIALWLPNDFGLFYWFSCPYVHFLLPGSVFPSSFRMILDFFTLFLCFMSILNCSAPYFSLVSGWFWTFLLLFLSLYPFSPAQLRISFWLPDDFGLFYAFSVLYVHFLLPGSVFLFGFRMILDFFLLFLCFMSIFSCSVPYCLLVSGWFWTFLRFFCALCPFSSAQFSISF